MQPKSTRKSPRVQHFDYTTPGYYFVTICSHLRKQIFSRVNGSSVELSMVGSVIQRHLNELTDRHKHIELDSFVIMPNHVHAITVIRPGTDSNPFSHDTSVMPITRVMGYFKGGVTMECRELSAEPELEVWQRSFHERYVRDDSALHRFREYIQLNPLQWHLDEENQDRSGLNQFYLWQRSL